ncbi:MAG: hypothetical protein DHS20C08_01670 [Rhodomicrobium sp.]|nr:MAG: hypothetical protein DHS20C08_01670 [Rhodomicrobium sp.]
MASANNTGSKLILGLVVVAVLAVAGYFFYNKSSEKADQAKVGAESTALAENIMGEDDAPVTIIEYSSMTCPHCAVFHKETLPGLKKNYIKTGKVKYILREFPLDQLAAAAFMLGRCLDKKDGYFDFIDMLYERQREWAFSEDRIGSLKNLAKQAGFTDESFKACLDDKALYAQVLAVKNNGTEEFRIRSTPTFFVNGTRLEGAQSLADFEKLIKPIAGE